MRKLRKEVCVGTPTVASAKPPKVVIAYLDGRRVQGYVFDFSPMRETCRIFPSQTAHAGEDEVVELKRLKAIFFLQDVVGDPAVTAIKSPVASQRRRLEVYFHDKERLEGTTEGYSKDRQGFFMVPEDPTGKILRVFVINRNVKEVKWLQPGATPAAPSPPPQAS
ncbi:MAG: hypothetical protein HY316_01845 [Acidobacteria bacterium]|nr:hypothetical protein [Acidobacteriota bacterium]